MTLLSITNLKSSTLIKKPGSGGSPISLNKRALHLMRNAGDAHPPSDLFKVSDLSLMLARGPRVSRYKSIKLFHLKADPQREQRIAKNKNTDDMITTGFIFFLFTTRIGRTAHPKIETNSITRLQK